MNSLTKHTCLPICIVLYSAVSLGVHPVTAFAQEGEEISRQEVHNAPENVSGKLEGNEAELLNSWRLLSGLAVRLLSGNTTDLLSGNEPELLSGNSTRLLSGNAPELLTGNDTRLLSGNDPTLLSGNKLVLFSHNTLQVHFADSGNNNTSTLGDPSRDLPDVRARSQRQQEDAIRQESRMRAQMQAAAARAREVAEKERMQVTQLTNELAVMREELKNLAAQNNILRARISELESAK